MERHNKKNQEELELVIIKDPDPIDKLDAIIKKLYLLEDYLAERLHRQLPGKNR